jgi:hypothetical protein
VNVYSTRCFAPIADAVAWMMVSQQRFDVAGRLVGQRALAQIDRNELARGSGANVDAQDANTRLSRRQQRS